MEYLNETEIWLWHLKRGGGHAIVNWIAQNSGKSLFHLNNCFSKPLKVRLRRKKIFRIISRSLDHKGPQRLFGLNLPPETNWREIAAMPKEILLCSLENVKLKKAAKETLYHGGAENILGPSAHRIDILILRDALNTFASVGKSKTRMRRRLKSFYPDNWKKYALEFLGRTHFLPRNTIMLSYNAWFESADYRKQLAARIGLPSSEIGLDTLSSDGGGSSFSGREFSSNARSLNVKGRWKHFLDDPLYLSALDAETISLSEEIFGDVSGGVITPQSLDELRARARRNGK